MDRQIRSKEGGGKGDGGRRRRVSWQHRASSYKTPVICEVHYMEYGREHRSKVSSGGRGGGVTSPRPPFTSARGRRVDGGGGGEG